MFTLCSRIKRLRSCYSSIAYTACRYLNVAGSRSSNPIKINATAFFSVWVIRERYIIRTFVIEIIIITPIIAGHTFLLIIIVCRFSEFSMKATSWSAYHFYAFLCIPISRIVYTIHNTTGVFANWASKRTSIFFSRI